MDHPDWERGTALVIPWAEKRKEGMKEGLQDRRPEGPQQEGVHQEGMEILGDEEILRRSWEQGEESLFSFLLYLALS